MSDNFHIEICPQPHGNPPLVVCTPAARLLDASDEALCARMALQALGLVFVQGQRLTFHADIPPEVLQ